MYATSILTATKSGTSKFFRFQYNKFGYTTVTTTGYRQVYTWPLLADYSKKERRPNSSKWNLMFASSSIPFCDVPSPHIPTTTVRGTTLMRTSVTANNQSWTVHLGKIHWSYLATSNAGKRIRTCCFSLFFGSYIRRGFHKNGLVADIKSDSDLSHRNQNLCRAIKANFSRDGTSIYRSTWPSWKNISGSPC